ncbi:MAG: ATP-binding protein [Akkermansia sp.]|nr:ATP-binding protein [Akkermansia sp.]
MSSLGQLPHERTLHNMLGSAAPALQQGGRRSVVRIENNERDERLSQASAETAADDTPSTVSAEKAVGVEQGMQFNLAAPLYSLEDVVLNADTRKKLETLLTVIRKHDFIYSTWGLADVDHGGRCVSVNFYGPPGTGKTMCAMALAHAFGKKIIDVDYAELESKYVGDTGKNIEAAFRFAREHDAVLFFDEADSILGKRMSQVTQATDHAVNTSRAVMLKQLDQYDGIVVFASNLAENFDKAFSRRILSHIEVGLPDAPSRRILWQKFMMPTVPGAGAVEVEQLLEASEHMSGGDMKNAFVKACALACLEPEPRLSTAHLLDTIAQVKKANNDVSNSSGTQTVRRLAAEEINSILHQ